MSKQQFTSRHQINKKLDAKKSFSINQHYFSNIAYRNFALGLFSFLVAFLVASTFAPASTSSAESAVLNGSVTVNNTASGYYVTVSNANAVELNVDSAPAGVLATGQDTINVKTNAPNGYRLYLSAASANLYNSTDTTQSGVHLSPVAGTLEDKKTLGQNTWGFSLDDASTMELASSAIWSGVLDTGETLISETDTPNYDTGVDTAVYYGVNANSTLTTGSYGTTIYYTALAEGVTEPFMQEFTNEQCSAMATDSTTKLMDSRNAKIYTIVKARDGNCWMADNLEISDTTITSADSNINSGSFYIPGSSEWNTNDYSQALVHVVTEDSTSGISGEAKVPYLGQTYYNWYAATAGAQPVNATSNVTTSICPKGWRLPENSTETGAKSWSNLISAYSDTVSTGADLITDDTTAPQYNLGFRLYYGYWNHTYATENVQGSNSLFLSSTPFSETKTYDLTYSSSAIYPQDNSNKGHGFSVRCVFGDSRTLQDITYMQDINTNICQNTAETTSYADAKLLQDKRGTGNAGGTVSGYKVVKAKDGNCWMADNLNLYNKTISATDSDFTSPTSYTIPASITATNQWNSNVYSPATDTSSANPKTGKKVEVAQGLGNNASSDAKYKGQVYYNWTVAVAKEDTTSYTTTGPDTSICPKGFTLPVNGDSTRDKSWAKLLNAYGITTGAQLLANSTLGVSLYYGHWDLGDESEGNQGGAGYFWSGTPSSETGAYHLGYNSDAVYSQYNGVKGHGLSIRCVAH